MTDVTGGLGRHGFVAWPTKEEAERSSYRRYPKPRDKEGPVKMMPASVAAAFTRAIAVADAYRGATSPNPPVGCVLLDAEGRMLALGAHRKAGERHAEAEALQICRQTGSLGAIRTVVVTLEPCNHWGRTPPCAEAILETSAKIVWIGARDPNPRVAGGGATRLAEAGIEVRDLAGSSADPAAATLFEACRDLIGPFAKRALTGRPWITVKQAMDPSGSMIPPPGRKTFTSAPALDLAHRLRKRADGILTGSGTILADDPHFTVRRVADHPGKRRALAILDRRGRVPASYLAAAEARGFAASVESDLETALDRLGRDGALEILVEAGPALTAAMLDADLWDEHVVIRSGSASGADQVTIIRPDGGSRQVELAAPPE